MVDCDWSGGVNTMYVNGCEIKQLVPFSPERSAARQPAITCKQLERRAGYVTMWGTPCVTMWGTQLSVVSLERRAGCVTVWGTPWFRGSTSAQRPSPSQRGKSASYTASVEAESTALRSSWRCTVAADQTRASASFQRAFPAPIHHAPVHHAAGTPRRGWSSG